MAADLIDPMATTVDAATRAQWQVPAFDVVFWKPASARGRCVIIPVLNEGARIRNLARRMHALGIGESADVIIVDGGSTDGSLDQATLETMGVRGLLRKTGPGRLSAQLRCGYAFAIDHGYEAIVTIDGNDKDDPDAIPRFIEALQ